MLSLSGCSKTDIDSDLAAAGPFRSPLIKLVIIPVSYKDHDFADCLRHELKEELEYLELIPEYIFRDTMFPWFEPCIRPKSTKELLSFVKKTIVRDQIDILGIDVLIYVKGSTTWDEFDGPGGCFGGYGGGGCFGYVSKHKETYISTVVVDLNKTIFLGDTKIISKGVLAVPLLIMPFPIPLGLFTETSACSQTAQRIANSLTSLSLSK